jgi:hypothetical protein
MAAYRQFYPVTDNLVDHLATCGCSLERLVQALIPSDDGQPHLVGGLPTSDEIEEYAAIVALQSVLPKDIANVPIKKILKFRNQHRAEMTAFQNGIHDFVTKLEKLQEIKDPLAIKTHLQAEYDSMLRPQLDDLTKYLKSLGIDTVMGAMNIRVALPPLLTSTSEYFTQSHIAPINPIVVGTSALAFSTLTVIRDKRKLAREAFHPSPTAYLFYLEEDLKPTTLLSRITQNFRRFLFGV